MANAERSREREITHPSRAQERPHPPVRVESSEWDWAQPTNLSAPDPRPGYRQHWIRVDEKDTDLQNYQKAQRAGWTPRRADTVPAEWGEIPSVKGGKFEGFIYVRGNVLCEMPEERAQQRDRFIRARIDRQTETIERDVHKYVPEGTLQETRTSKVAVGSRTGPRVPPVADE